MKRILPLLLLFICLSGYTQTIDLTKYDEFLKKHVSAKGVVNFDKVLKNIDELNSITENFSKISPNKGWSKSEYKTFWINFYNANIIKLLAENYPIKSINYIVDAFKIEVVDYDGGKISLDFIQHELLRPLGDPRVNFALYATTISSPMLNRVAYKPETVEQELEAAAINFINDPTKNKIDMNASKISKIFEWYKDDFGDEEAIKHFINKYSGSGKVNMTTNLFYMEYDWNLHRK